MDPFRPAQPKPNNDTLSTTQERNSVDSLSAPPRSAEPTLGNIQLTPPITDEERRSVELAQIENGSYSEGAPDVSVGTPVAMATEKPSSTGFSTTTKKSYKKAIVITSIVTCVLLGGVSAWAYTAYVIQNPQRVIMDAIGYYLSSTRTQHTLVVTPVTPVGEENGVLLKEINMVMNTTSEPTFDGNATIKLQYNKKDIPLKGKAIFTQKGELFYQLNDVDRLVTMLMDMSGSTEQLSTPTKNTLKTLSDKWIKVAAKDIENIDEKASKGYQCFVDNLKKHTKDTEIQKLYEKNQFITVKEKLPVKDGSLGYRIGFDTTKSEVFGNALESTSLGKDLKKCADTASQGTENESVNSSDAMTWDVTIWVGEWNHQLSKLEVTAIHKNSDTHKDEKIKADLGIKYDTSVKSAEVPKQSMTLEEWIQEIMTTLMAQGGSQATTPVPSSTRS